MQISLTSETVIEFDITESRYTLASFMVPAQLFFACIMQETLTRSDKARWVIENVAMYMDISKSALDVCS